MERFIWNDKQKEDFIDMLLDMWDAFSLCNCPYFELRLQSRDDTPFFIHLYHIMEDQKVMMQREMEQLEKWVVIEKMFDGIQLTSFTCIIKEKTTQFVQSS